MTAVWVVIAALALATAALKLAGPLALGGRRCRPGAERRRVAGLGAARGAGRGRDVRQWTLAVLDARVLGAAFAAVAVWRRAPMIVVVLGAAAVTALARLLLLGAAAAERASSRRRGAPVGDAAVENRPAPRARPPGARSPRPLRAGRTRRSSRAGRPLSSPASAAARAVR